MGIRPASMLVSSEKACGPPVVVVFDGIALGTVVGQRE